MRSSDETKQVAIHAVVAVLFAIAVFVKTDPILAGALVWIFRAFTRISRPNGTPAAEGPPQIVVPGVLSIREERRAVDGIRTRDPELGKAVRHSGGSFRRLRFPSGTVPKRGWALSTRSGLLGLNPAWIGAGRCTPGGGGLPSKSPR